MPWTRILRKMDYFVVLLCFNLVLTTLAALTNTEGSKSDLQLINALLNPATYDRRVLPRNRTTGKVAIKLAVVVERINSVDDRGQEINWVGYVQATWNNPFLSWDPNAWNGTKFLYLKEQDMWVPDISIIERLNDDIDFREQKRRILHVNYKGDIRWLLGGDVITTRCPLDIQRFPFDTQTCPMHIGSYVIPAEEIETIDANQSLYDGIGGSNALWTVTGWETKLVSYTYDTTLGSMTYKYLHFTLHLARKPTYYVINIITPLLLMSLLMTVVFRLPADGGEKIGFGITLLLALNVIQLVITETMPKTSDSMPIISAYVACLMGLSASSIPLSVLVIYIHNHGYSSLPRWLRGRLCLDHKYDGSSHALQLTSVPNNNAGAGLRADGFHSVTADGRPAESRSSPASSHDDSVYKDLVETIMHGTRLQTMVASNEHIEKLAAAKRKQAAKTLDNFLFWFYLSSIVIMAVVSAVLMAVL